MILSCIQNTNPPQERFYTDSWTWTRHQCNILVKRKRTAQALSQSNALSMTSSLASFPLSNACRMHEIPSLRAAHYSSENRFSLTSTKLYFLFQETSFLWVLSRAPRNRDVVSETRNSQCNSHRKSVFQNMGHEPIIFASLLDTAAPWTDQCCKI